MTCRDCDQCALAVYHKKKGTYSPVPDELNGPPEDMPLVVLPHPEDRDRQLGIPLTGRFAIDAVEAIDATFGRDDVNITHVVACPYPGDDRTRFMHAVKRENRKRAQKGQPLLLDPVEACRGVARDLSHRAALVLTLGKESLELARNAPSVVDDYRGAPDHTPLGRRLLATYAPRRIYFEKRFRETFARDIAKAHRYWTDSLNWRPTRVERNPPLSRVREFLDGVSGDLTWDLETDGIEAGSLNIRCIGLATQDEAIVIHFKSCELGRKHVQVPYVETHCGAQFPVDPGWFPYSLDEYEEIIQLLDRVMADPEIRKIGHNSTYFDSLVWWAHYGYIPVNQRDTILLHHLSDNELLHRLQFVTTYYLDPPPWKSEHTAVTSKTDKELGEYCGLDTIATARIEPLLWADVRAKRQEGILEHSERLQEIATGMRRIGMQFDEAARQRHLSDYGAKRSAARAVLDEMAPHINPASPQQIRQLLFQDWGLPWQALTDTGLPSTNAASIRRLLMERGVTAEQKEYLKQTLRWRKADKVITTYLNKFAPGSDLLIGGRVHSDYSVVGTLGGRYSSANPNGQNFPYVLRDMFIPDDGYVFVYADMDQLEMRMAAALAGCQLYLDSFSGELDIEPHGVTAEMMLGDAYWKLPGALPPGRRREKPKDGTPAGRARGATKNVYYGAQYGAGIPTLMDQLSKIEDKDGNMLFADWTEDKVKLLVRRWKKAAHEYVAWWAGLMDQARNRGYIEEPVWGRRNYLKGGIKVSDVANFVCQSGGFAVTALGMFDILRQIPFDYDKRIGFVNQSHDSVMLHVPRDRAEEVLGIVENSLRRRVPGLDVDFTAEAKIYENGRGK